MIGAIIADIVQKAVGAAATGVASYQGAKRARRMLRDRSVAGAELAPLAGGYLSQAVRGQALTRADIAPQIAAAVDENAKTRRALYEGLAGQDQMTQRGLGAVSEGVARATGSVLKDVYAQQAALNLQARQQAAAQIQTASAQTAQLRRQRDVMLGQLAKEQESGFWHAISATK